MPSKRPYRLTEAGMNALKSTARLNQPWSHSTGPRTEEGKGVSRMNALKHGERSLLLKQVLRQGISSI